MTQTKSPDIKRGLVGPSVSGSKKKTYQHDICSPGTCCRDDMFFLQSLSPTSFYKDIITSLDANCVPLNGKKTKGTAGISAFADLLASVA